MLKSETILVEIGVGSHSLWHFIGGEGADDNDGYLREAFAHHVKKLRPRHARHIEIRDNYIRKAAAEFSNRIQAVNRHPNDIPSRHQVSGDKLSDKRFVVNQ